MAEISYENKTLAKVTVEGRIVDSEPGAWVVLDLPTQDPIKVYLGEGVTVTVVAPPEWPPIEDTPDWRHVPICPSGACGCRLPYRLRRQPCPRPCRPSRSP